MVWNIKMFFFAIMWISTNSNFRICCISSRTVQKCPWAYRHLRSRWFDLYRPVFCVGDKKHQWSNGASCDAVRSEWKWSCNSIKYWKSIDQFGIMHYNSNIELTLHRFERKYIVAEIEKLKKENVWWSTQNWIDSKNTN